MIKSQHFTPGKVIPSCWARKAAMNETGALRHKEIRIGACVAALSLESVTVREMRQHMQAETLYSDFHDKNVPEAGTERIVPVFSISAAEVLNAAAGVPAVKCEAAAHQEIRSQHSARYLIFEWCCNLFPTCPTPTYRNEIFLIVKMQIQHAHNVQDTRPFNLSRRRRY
jgi:hypothetical protein